jgi:hypothetical protein
MMDEFISATAVSAYERQLIALVGERLRLTHHSPGGTSRAIRARFPVVYDKLLAYQTAHRKWAEALRKAGTFGASQDRLWRRRETTRKVLVTVVRKQALRLAR